MNLLNQLWPAASADVAGLPIRIAGLAITCGHSAIAVSTVRLDWSVLLGSLKPSSVVYLALVILVSDAVTASAVFSLLPAIMGTKPGAEQLANGVRPQL